MRAFEGVFIVAAFAFAFAASANVTTEASTSDKSNETQSIVECLGSHIRRPIELSRNNTWDFLVKLSPKGNFNKTWYAMNNECNNLQAAIENTTELVVGDRAKCEENNKTSIIRRNCDLLAKIAYVQKISKLLTAFMGKSIQIIVKTGVSYPIENLWGNAFRFAKDQNRLFLQTLSNAVSCIRSK